MTVKTPPRVQRTTQTWKDHTADMEWLREHEHEYQGEYVLLDGGQLIAHGTDLSAALKEAAAKGCPEPLVYFAPIDDGTIFWSGIL